MRSDADKLPPLIVDLVRRRTDSPWRASRLLFAGLIHRFARVAAAGNSLITRSENSADAERPVQRKSAISVMPLCNLDSQ